MIKGNIQLFILIALTALFLTPNAYAVRLLTKKAALKKVFGSNPEIIYEKKPLSEKLVKEAEERLSGSLYNFDKEYDHKNFEVGFYFNIIDGKKDTAAIIDVEMGKMGPAMFIIALNLDGTVKEVHVMRYSETRGRGMARKSFLKQFIGKSYNSPIQVRVDINAISGATVSSKCASYTVKKALILYELLYLR